MRVEAVMFDLDGTLLNTLEDLANSMNTVLKKAGLPVHPLESYKMFIGSGVDTLVRKALPREVADVETPRYLQMMEQEYDRNWAARTRPYPGIEELLDFLTGNRYKLAVFSNKPDAFVKLCVKRFLNDWHFTEIVGAQPSVPLKPDPAAALGIAGRMAVAPARFLYLGDSGIDMRTAAAAGMFPAGALWGFREAAELQANGAKILLNRPEELIDRLKG